MYGYSGDPLLEADKGILKNIYAGHIAVYIGKEDGEDYIVEAMADGIVKTPAKYFVNSANGEKFLGAKIPGSASPIQLAKVVALAKSLAGQKMGYDFDFHNQKGPGGGQWTCVGLAEKLYESADISNPNNLTALEYDPEYYAVNITPDGYDDYSVANSAGDCFSREKEFSKIARRANLLIPAPELIGFDLGLEYNGDRYVFLPYTQFLQPTLDSVSTDIAIASYFSDSAVRGPLNITSLVLRWSLINNPWSSLKKIVGTVKDFAINLSAKIFNPAAGSSIVLGGGDLNSVSSSSAVKKSPAVKKTTTVKKAAVKKAPVAVKPRVSVQTASNKPVTSDEKISSQKVSAEKASSPKTSVKKTTAAPAASSASSSVILSAAASYYSPTVVLPNSAVSVSDSGSAADWPAEVFINKIYSTGKNNWVELFNFSDQDFDLAASGYRLERTKTAQDPSLIIRLGNAADGSYPGGTVIKAHDSYLIVNDEADDYYRALADAIASREEFSWAGSGYTIYLGDAAISSSTDLDIVDAVGFGPDASYFLGRGPASEIIENHILNRIAMNSDNVSDFNLILSADPSIIIATSSLATSSLATSTTVTETDDVATTADSIATSSLATSTVATETDEVATTTEIIVSSSNPPESPGLALINKIYSTGDDDWLELFNFGDSDFDLAASQYRLEKTMTATDPGLIMRIGNSEDGFYPGGTIIKAHDNYLIVRDDAKIYYKDKADAIATRDEFGWAGSGYSLYLSNAPVSSSTDPDIVDLVGFGSDATYFKGSAPALKITDNYILNRIATTGDNASDFNLIPSDDPDIINAASPDSSFSDLADLFTPPVPLESPGLTDLWHFDDCYGEGERAVGKWDCSRKIGLGAKEFTASLSSSLDLNNFSLSFDYKKALIFARVNFELYDNSGRKLLFILEPGLLTVEGLLGSDWRYYRDIPFDNSWRRAVFTVNRAAKRWALYIDGKEIVKDAFIEDLSSFDRLEVSADCDPILLDELAVWNRPLSPAEILSDYLANVPYSPMLGREPQKIAELIHLWNFNEGAGPVALDSVGDVDFQGLLNSWTSRHNNGGAWTTLPEKEIAVDFSSPIAAGDLSLSFWWRNSAYPSDGRTFIRLLSVPGGVGNIFGIATNYYRPEFYFNGGSGIITQGIDASIPYDNAWHHLALIYDSYRYKLNFYVDGEEKASFSLVKLKDGEEIGRLSVSSNNDKAEIDDLSIYSGALSPAQVKKIYSDTK
jgi:hypothetical protein